MTNIVALMFLSVVVGYVMGYRVGWREGIAIARLWEEMYLDMKAQCLAAMTEDEDESRAILESRQLERLYSKDGGR